ncbi:MAG: MFS transporter [Candidatus Melainabacteria bacterium]|nr:MFS transporter [Candidatus Melainabacteria bacterium]
MLSSPPRFKISDSQAPKSLAASFSAPFKQSQIPLLGILGVSLAGFSAYLNLYATQALLPVFTKVFHVTRAETGLTLSATTAAIAFAAPFIGLLSDRRGRKPVVVTSIFLLVVPCLLAAFANNLSELIAVRFVQGLILPGVLAILMAYVGEEWCKRGAGFAMSVFISLNILGGFLGRLIPGLIAANFGWRNAFVASAILCFFCGVAVLKILPSSSAFAPSKGGLNLDEAREHLKNPQTVSTFFIGATILFGIIATFTYLTFHLAEAPYSLDENLISWLFAVYLIGVVVTPMAGRFIDRITPKRSFLIAQALCITGLLVTLIPNLMAILIGLCISCTALFICQSANQAALRGFASKGLCTATGIHACFYYLGGGLGGYIPGLVWDQGGWSACAFVIIAANTLAALTAMFIWQAPSKSSI